MAQDYEVVLKLLFRQSGHGIVRELTGLGVTTWLDKELPEVRNTGADMRGETADGELLHFEFQIDNARFTELRMAGYYVYIYRLFGRHPIQILIYVGRERLRLTDRFTSPSMDFHFRLIDFSQMDGESFLASALVSDRILAVLMRLKNRTDAIRQILEGIATLEAGERADALRQLLILSGLRGLTSKIEREAQEMPVFGDLLDNKVFFREYKKGLDKGIEQGLEKGIEKGEAKLLRRLIEHRFKRIPKWAEARLADATPGQIEAWGQRLLDASTLREIFIFKSTT